MKEKKASNLVSYLWDFCCLTSLIGIWPRYIEPNTLTTTALRIKIPHLDDDLTQLRILQFSDLHFNDKTTEAFLEKIIKIIDGFSPHIILFTGDFLCYSQLKKPDLLLQFLNKCIAPYGSFAVLGNHDYAQKLEINELGEYDLLENDSSEIVRGLKRLLRPVKVSGKFSDRARKIPYHADLLKLLEKSPFELLDNRSKLVPIKSTGLNICGVGEHILGRCRPEEAFHNWNQQYPGIVLAHNPDSLPNLLKYPGDLILCGHTHGGQVNLPMIWKRFTLMENPLYKRGLFQLNDKQAYINRGVGSTLPFRWFATPEITLITLEKL